MIEFICVSKKFDGDKVVENFSLRVADGEKVVLMGESGGGKTTLLNIASGLIKPDSGEIKVDGKLAYMFQEPRLLPTFNVKDNVMAVLKSKNRDALADKCVSLVELDAHADKFPAELSGGMAQRVAFARFLAFAEENCASLLLLDEPFSALDEDMRDRMIAILLEFAKDKSIIYVTHNSGEAEKISETVIKL